MPRRVAGSRWVLCLLLVVTWVASVSSQWLRHRPPRRRACLQRRPRLRRRPPTWAAHDWWLLAVPPVVAIGVIGLGWVVLGRRIAVYAVLTATVVVLSLFQVHAGFRLAYLDGDTAIDTMIYNTTSPDVTQMTHDLEAMSDLIYGDRSMAIAIMSPCLQWPSNWYLRGMPNAFLTDDPVERGVQGTPVILARNETGDGCTAVERIPGYTAQTSVLRWHEPDSIYRQFAIAPEVSPGRSAWHTTDQPHGVFDIVRSVMSSLATLFTQSGQIRDFRLLAYREMPGGTNGYFFQIYNRNDLLPYYDAVRFGG